MFNSPIFSIVLFLPYIMKATMVDRRGVSSKSYQFGWQLGYQISIYKIINKQKNNRYQKIRNNIYGAPITIAIFIECDDPIYNKYLEICATMFQARLEDSAVFRKIIDSIKDLVKNVNIDVTQKGLSIQAMDSCHIALVSLQLKEKAFSNYNCQKPLTLGLAIENVSKILKIAGSDDSLTLSCQEQPSELKFKFQSKKGDKISEFNLSLMTIDAQNLGIPDTDFSSICTMPSGEFSRVCKEYVGLSESIKIETTKQNIKFAINGEIGSGCSTLTQQDTGSDHDSILLDVDEPVSLSFASRYLNLFSRAGGLSSQVVLNMSNETPLMVMYKIMNGMGQIQYFLAPKITEED